MVTLETIYNVVNDCIGFGIHGAFNRMIKALIESPSPKEDVVVSNFIRMSNFENSSHKQMISKVAVSKPPLLDLLLLQVVEVHLPQLTVADRRQGSFQCDSSDELLVPSSQIYEAFK